MSLTSASSDGLGQVLYSDRLPKSRFMMPREDYLKMPLRERLLKLSKSDEERASELQEKQVFVDLHTHVFREFDRARVRNSGVTCFFEAIYQACRYGDFEESMRVVGSIASFVHKQPDMMIALNHHDILKAKAQSKQAVMFQLEPQTIGRKLDNIDIAYGFGVRMMLLTFNTRDYIGNGCGERSDDGLSYYGMEVVDRMNRIGMLIDVSHCGDSTSRETIDTSRDPVLISHGGARALCPRIKRLSTDECIKALAEKGGLIGIYAVPNFLALTERQGIQDVLNHIDYVVKLVGIDHVGIGTDIQFLDHVAFHRDVMMKSTSFSRIGVELKAKYMEGIENPEETSNILRGLIARGYSDNEISRIAGGNALKVFEKVLGRGGDYTPQYIPS